ncbi:slam family member 5-like [Limosa lapponica baueri]|uniref:Slam family member 5-like n=1 Tax=Limosa lapponica baueri TaxID=1758121 RepID=A0A2I0T7F9_LIMLA|nr:slam family member 5-like [Limosa lapponica baueri]
MVGIVVASTIGAVVVLAVIVFLIYCKSKEASAEYMTVYAQVGPYQQVPQQSLSKEHQKDPKKTPSPNVETSQTIYFTIQAKAQTDDEKMGSGRPGCQEQDEKTLYSSVGQPEALEQPWQGSSTAMNLL